MSTRKAGTVNKAASTLAKARWAKTSKKDRVKAAKHASDGRMLKITPARRSEIAKQASEAITPEARKKAALKAWETRRKNKAG